MRDMQTHGRSVMQSRIEDTTRLGAPCDTTLGTCLFSSPPCTTKPHIHVWVPTCSGQIRMHTVSMLRGETSVWNFFFDLKSVERFAWKQGFIKRPLQ